MSVSYEEMEAKRQEMISSFRDIAAAMTRCVAIIEDYARLAPSTLTTSAALAAVHDGSSTVDALASLSANKKLRAKKDKKPKDPNAPKRPPSAYLLFQNDIRENIRQSHPGLPYKEVLGVIANRWKELDDNSRKVYEDAYMAATANYRAQEDAYKAGGVIPAHLLANFAAVQAAMPIDSDDDDSSDDDVVNATPSKLPPTLAATPLPSAKKPKRKNNADILPAADKKTKKNKK